MLGRKVIIGKNKQALYVPGGFKIQIVIANDGDSFTLPLVNPVTMGEGTGYNFIVTWGDGNNNTISTYNDANITHTYSTAGTYDIEIKGQCDGWSFNNSGSKLLLTKVLNWGDDDFEGFSYLQRAFYGCSNLTELPLNQTINERLEITNLYFGFYDCSSLQSIPSCLFDNITKLELIQYCFRNCSSLQSIPSGLFDNNTLITDVNSCFAGCSSLQSIPSGLFNNNTLITNVNSCFFRCSSLQLIPSGLFDNNTLITSFVSTFRDCDKLQVTNNIFKYDNFYNKIINFYATFNRLLFTGVQGTAPDLWNIDFGSGYPSSITGCFGGAGNNITSLTNYADIPGDWK